MRGETSFEMRIHNLDRDVGGRCETRMIPMYNYLSIYKYTFSPSSIPTDLIYAKLIHFIPSNKENPAPFPLSRVYLRLKLRYLDCIHN
jgi:hypothetical protein